MKKEDKEKQIERRLGIVSDLNLIVSDKPYVGELTQYAVESIKTGRGNYPIANLMAYCEDMNVTVKLIDMNTDDEYPLIDQKNLHEILGGLMYHYNVTPTIILREGEVYYTPPGYNDEKRKVEEEELTISVDTFMGVCDVLHCYLKFESE